MGSYLDVLRDRAREHRAQAARRAAGERVDTFLPTGFRDWDRNGGIKLGCLSIVAGDTGEGKSHVKRALTGAVARAGYPVLVLDFEDPARDTADREFADATGIPAHVLGAGEYPESDLDRLDAAVAEAEEWAGRIDYHPELLRVRDAVDLVRGSNARLVVLDYVQAMNADEGKSMERTLADLAWDLSEWSKANDAAVVALSQVKSDVAERGQAWFSRYQGEGWQKAIRGYRPGPGKSDLAWCGALGERCKDLSYIHRPGRWARALGWRDVKDDTMEIIKAKVSFGREGTIRLGFDGEHSRLFDLPGR